MNEKTFPFIIYMIHVCADRWGISPSAVYRTLQKADCINQYLLPNYEILHTQSSGAVADDIEQYLSLRGVAV